MVVGDQSGQSGGRAAVGLPEFRLIVDDPDPMGADFPIF